ncbi:alpha/beta hydrolase [bacterium]|nr:alpha/beta hydrolase [bacterium]
MAESSRSNIRNERIHFTNKDGERLAGILDLPADGEPKEFAIFSHCFTCSKQYKVAVYTGRFLAEHGIGMLRYDYPGLGESEGDFSQTTFQGYVSDVRYAAEFLRKNYSSPTVLIGHSFGGGASLAAASSIQSVKLVVTFAATARPGELRPGFKSAYEEAQSTGLGRINTDGKPRELRKEFFDRLKEVDLEPSVRALRPHLIAVHASEDNIVPFENAETLVRWAPRSRLLKMDGAGHLFMDEQYVKPVTDEVAKKVLE